MESPETKEQEDAFTLSMPDAVRADPLACPDINVQFQFFLPPDKSLLLTQKALAPHEVVTNARQLVKLLTQYFDELFQTGPLPITSLLPPQHSPFFQISLSIRKSGEIENHASIHFPAQYKKLSV